jgi:ribosome-binding factor A
MGKKAHDPRYLSGAYAAQRGAAQRQLRVGEELRHGFSEIFRRGECRDPALQDVSIAVTEVRVSPDLRNATVFVMPLGGANANQVLAGLQRSSAFLRRLVARNVILRYTHGLKFALDDSFDQAERIGALLARPDVARDLHPDVARSEDDDDAA